MFKNNKEKENNYISTEDIEKIYGYQKKSFDGKIAEQQKQIDQLTNYISARFGENVANSNIATKLNNIEKNLQEIQTSYKTNLEKTTKELKKQIEDKGKKIAADLNDSQTESYFKLLQKNENDLTKIKKLVDESKENDKKLAQLDGIIKEFIKSSEMYQKEVQKELKETNQKIGKINYLGISSKFDKKLKEECSKIEDKIEEAKQQTKTEAYKNSEGIVNLVGSLDERLSKENEVVKNSVQNVQDKLNELDKKFLGEIETVSANIQVAEIKTQSLEENIINKFAEIDEGLQNNQTEINKLEENMQKGFEKAKQEEKQAINKLKESAKEKNAKIEEKIKQVKADIKTVQNETKTMETNWAAKLGEIQQETNNLYTKIQTEADEKIDTKLQEVITDVENSKLEIAELDNKLNDKIEKIIQDVKLEKTQIEDKFNSQIENAIKNTKEESEKIKEELNQQILNSNKENKTELQNIVSTVDIIKNTMDVSYENIGQEILKLKEEAKSNLEKQQSSVTDIELLKKDYNKYVTKMNNELAKISKAIINAQKKNLETNQNLQVKIKAYIDNRIAKADNTQRVKDLINKLDLSIQEREKLQKIEMEEILNKKLKAIQKENERILNEKIEEISSKFIRENSSYTRTKPNKVTLYEEAPKKKKNMYELIDQNQILKRSASSKKTITTSQEGKSQILKFFYDEEE